jgi:hypothetical protein
MGERTQEGATVYPTWQAAVSALSRTAWARRVAGGLAATNQPDCEEPGQAAADDRGADVCEPSAGGLLPR